MKDYLIVSEQFLSIQGEGKSLGTPAVFLRLAACNLTCPGFSYINPETGVKQGCDTTHVWRKGKRIKFSEIIHHWQQQGWLDKLNQGAHLVITGGEPLVQQQALINFINQLHKQAIKPFIEIETNVTIALAPEMLDLLDQINASPKLPSAGNDLTKSFKPEVIKQYASSNKTCFKFVLCSPQDMNVIEKDYLSPFNIQTKNVWLMPEGGTRKDMEANSDWVIELCKKHGMHFSPRLQVLIWNDVTGV